MAGIKHLRTWVTVRCSGCEHEVRTPLPPSDRKDEDGFLVRPRFRCSRCGALGSVHVPHSTESWARRRMGK